MKMARIKKMKQDPSSHNSDPKKELGSVQTLHTIQTQCYEITVEFVW